MNSIAFQHNKKIIMLVLALVAAISSVVTSIAYFTDRANRTTTVQTATFDAEGYELTRTAPEGYLTSGETIEVTLKESNNKSEDISSQITLTASWDSPVPDIYPWGNSNTGNIQISLDGEDVPYTENKEDNTISFVLPKNTLPSGAVDIESTLLFQIPSDLAATGALKFSFDQVELHSGEWSYECEKDTLTALDFAADVAWNISKDQTTALGNPNRDVLALLDSGAVADEYTLNIIKNGSDTNTNFGQMMNWTSEGQTPWAAHNITELNLSEGITTIGCYAFAGETGITKLSLPSTVNTIGISAFQGSGLSGELVIPATVTIIENLAFGDLSAVDTITFEHGPDDSLILPDNTSEGEETLGAFYVPDFIKTTFEFNGNPTAEEYNWVADNRMKVGISEIILSYNNIKKGETSEPALTISPNHHDNYQSIQYKLLYGENCAKVDADTGVVTGIATGTAIVQVTIVDANGDTLQTTASVTISVSSIQSASLSYEDAAIGSTVDPKLTYEPENAEVVSRKFEITTGDDYASVNTDTGVLTGTANGVAVVKVTLTDASGKETVASCAVSVGTPVSGTRHVWKKYNTTTGYTESSASIRTAPAINTTIYVGSGYRINSNGTFSLSGAIELADSLYCNQYPYAMVGSTSGTTLYKAFAISSIYFWQYNGIGLSCLNNYGGNDGLYELTLVPGTAQGTFSSNVSSSSSGSYPIDALSGSYWYVYQGSDNIDAEAITYSANRVTAGEEFTVNVSESTKNVYGGTISYQYEYSTDGGSTWATAGTTSATSKDLVVPEDADSFAARVKASDNWGFASPVYTYGGSVTVVPPTITISSAPAQNGTLTYTGSAQSPTWNNYDSTQLTIGGTYSATNAGTYSATFTPNTGYVWSDGTTTAKTVNWTIEKAEGSLSLSSEALSVTKGETKTITVTRAGNGTISAKSSDTSVATVSISGTKVTVKGIVTGTVTITISVDEGTNHTAPSDAAVSATVTAVPVSSAALSYSNVAIGSTASPTLTIEPSNADITSTTYEITAGSSYATINASSGVLTGKGNGVVAVKATIVDETGKETIASCIVTCGTPAAGTRYVWEKYSTTQSYTDNADLDINNAGFIAAAGKLPNMIFCRKYNFDTTTGKYSVNTNYAYGTVDEVKGNQYTEDETGYPYWKVRKSTYPYLLDTSSNTLYQTYADEYMYWFLYSISSSGMSGRVHVDVGSESSGDDRLTTHTSELVVSQGSLVGMATATSSSNYPTNNYSGSYWYVYQGSDIIDADAVTYSANSVTAGEDITVNVTASTKNVYGGTISYRYEYSTDGGSTWTTAGTTTATSYTITTPDDASTFIARVKASDNWGFTSSVYVYGNSAVITPPPTPVSDLSAGSSVFLNVDGVPTEFLVVHQGIPDTTMYDSSCNGTWLLMKDIYETRQWDENISYNDYSISTIHSYLNNTFITLFDADIQSAIKEVKIPYYNRLNLKGEQTGANGLSTKVFLLCAYEVGATGTERANMAKIGTKLDYFESGGGDEENITTADTKRLAYFNGSATTWWLRGQMTTSSNIVTQISKWDGLFEFGDAQDTAGVRPALILPSDCTVDASGFIVAP